MKDIQKYTNANINYSDTNIHKHSYSENTNTYE